MVPKLQTWEPAKLALENLNMRLILLSCLLASLAGCTLLGPPSIDYSRAEIEKKAFIDRKSGEFGKLFAGLDAFGLTGPEVGFMTASQRIELAWTAKLPDAPFGWPFSIRIAVSGSPKLNASKQGVDLTDVRLEEFSMPSIPLVNFGGSDMRQGTLMGGIPLLQFAPDELRHDGVVYQADTIRLDWFGLHVNLRPK